MQYSKMTLLFLIIIIIMGISGVAALSVSYSSSTNMNGAYSSSMGGSSLSPGNSFHIQSSSVISGSGGQSGENTVGNESGSFTVDDPPSSDPEFGDLWVKSSPAGASVIVNKFNQPNLTPMLLTMLNPGNYSVTVKIDGYKPFSKEIEVIKGKEKTIVADFDGKWESGENLTTDKPVPEMTSKGVWA
jgi:hypothetical protein